MFEVQLDDFTFRSLEAELWQDFESLFGARGACGGCWCMYWRQTQNDYDALKGEANKQAMQHIVNAGKQPGILAYSNGLPVGWVALAPRIEYSRLDRSRILKPVDDRPVWSVVCFFVHKDYRRHGLSANLLRAAINYVRFQGGGILEGYPVEPKKDRMADVFAYTGLVSAFKKAGFREVMRRSPTRPIMRYIIE